MPWTSKSANGGSNDCVYVDPNSESKHRDYKLGSYYNGNYRKSAQLDLSQQGSDGLDRDQGFTRDSMIPETHENQGTVGQHTERIKIKTQGSHAHFKSGGRKKGKQTV